MIGRSEEFEKMFRIEEQLWWYRILHERVVDTIVHFFNGRRDVSILDAGCGTGGLLHFMRERGYTMLRGIDGSSDAVDFCHERGLPVQLVNLNELTGFEPDVLYDVIVCNDVFCYFNNDDLTRLLTQLARRLKPDGILISNNNAFGIFQGQHDLAVGSTRRFVQADFDRLMPPTGLNIVRSTYWSFLLAPLIVAMRQWQSWQLRLGWRRAENAQSDVYLPSSWVNKTLYTVVRLEGKLFQRTPFGSSLFIVSKPTQAVK